MKDGFQSPKHIYPKPSLTPKALTPEALTPEALRIMALPWWWRKREEERRVRSREATEGRNTRNDTRVLC